MTQTIIHKTDADTHDADRHRLQTSPSWTVAVLQRPMSALDGQPGNEAESVEFSFGAFELGITEPETIIHTDTHTHTHTHGKTAIGTPKVEHQHRG